MSKASNPDWQIYYDFLDNLREEETVNMFGARPYLAEAFDLDKQESRDILSAWMKEFSHA
jgi:hypothetical protein